MKKSVYFPNSPYVCYFVVCAAIMDLAMVPAREGPDAAHPPPSTNVLLPSGEGLTLHGRATTSLTFSDVIAIRTCRELEAKSCDHLASHFNKPVLLTGPILPESVDGTTKLDDHLATWLGRFGPGSVVFCAFGSQSNLNKAQFQELLLGFEMTKLPFLVALRPPEGCATVEEAFPEGGFTERVGERGVVYGEWVPQPQILAHPSVGCFVSHCGFGSMWESLMSDNQIVLIPQLVDQVLNAKIMARELKVAVEVEMMNGGDHPDGWVSKESLCKAIKSVMDQESEIGRLIW